MTLELSKDERSKLMGAPLAAALAVMTVDLGVPWAGSWPPRPSAMATTP